MLSMSPFLTLVLCSMVSSEVRHARLIAAVPGTEAHFYRESRYDTSGGSGFNPGYGDGGSGFNPGYNEGGSGYNPGYSNGGSGYNPGSHDDTDYGTVAFSARRADNCCRRSGARVVFDQSLTNLGSGWQARRGEFIAPASGTYSFSWSALSPDL